MNYKEFIKAVAKATDAPKLTKEIIDELALCAKEVGYTIPNCTCSNKWQDLLWHLQLFVKQHQDGYPKWKWNAPTKRLLLKDSTIIVKSNFTDEQADKWIEENPDKAVYFKLWNNRKTKKSSVEEKEQEVPEENKEQNEE